MCALSPVPFFSTIGWPSYMEDLIHHMDDNKVKNSYDYTTNEDQFHLHEQADNSQHQYPFSQLPNSPDLQHSQAELDTIRSTPSSTDPTVAKKLNHNASERDRRKKINSLYSSLRSLLPLPDHMKKLSIPSTVSRVIKYIPELQQQVEELVKKKEELMLRMSSRDSRDDHDGLRLHTTNNCNGTCSTTSRSSVVSTSRLNDNEIVVQITCSCNKGQIRPLSEILQFLEKDIGLLLLNASSFEPHGGRVFHNLHFQVDKTYRLESPNLIEQLLSIIENRDGLF